jgi:hypothetical protein
MSEKVKRARMDFWVAVTAGVLTTIPVGYPLSAGPALWLSARLDHPDWYCNALELIYGPMLGLAMQTGLLGVIYMKYIAWWGYPAF